MLLVFDVSCVLSSPSNCTKYIKVEAVSGNVLGNSCSVDRMLSFKSVYLLFLLFSIFGFADRIIHVHVVLIVLVLGYCLLYTFIFSNCTSFWF